MAEAMVSTETLLRPWQMFENVLSLHLDVTNIIVKTFFSKMAIIHPPLFRLGVCDFSTGTPDRNIAKIVKIS